MGDSGLPPTPTHLAFNRRGHYLAASYADGRVLLWDYYTRHGGDGLAGGSVLGRPQLLSS